MSLNEVLWSKLDLTRFGSLDNVEIFDTPQIAVFEDDYNPLHYGNGIFYKVVGNNDRMYIMHASCKHPEACSVVWNIYFKYHKNINDILGVKTIICNVDPSDVPLAYPREVVEMYGGVYR